MISDRPSLTGSSTKDSPIEKSAHGPAADPRMEPYVSKDIGIGNSMRAQQNPRIGAARIGLFNTEPKTLRYLKSSCCPCR